MTFDEWWEQNWSEFPQLHFAREAWEAATAAERSRCAGIAKKIGNLHLSRSEWLACSENIYEEITK